MKTFKEFVAYITEMATPTPVAQEKDFYHGTASREAAIGIAKHGIVAPEQKDRKGFLKPVQGKVYITPHLHYAQMYALGGDVAGSSYKPKNDYAYVFKVPGYQLKDVQPDEDSIGEMLSDYRSKDRKPHWLDPLAAKHLGDTTYKKAKEGDYAWGIRAGKTLVNKMSDDQKNEIIDKYGAHVAHQGTLIPSEIYRIHTSKIPLLKRDGSNFHEHAEKIQPHEI